jgi:hypothetical protein
MYNEHSDTLVIMNIKIKNVARECGSKIFCSHLHKQLKISDYVLQLVTIWKSLHAMQEMKIPETKIVTLEPQLNLFY